MLIDTSKVRGRIVKKYLYLGEFAKAINKELRFVSSYLGHQRYLNQNDISEWAKALDIPKEDIPTYFFAEIVHETEQGEQTDGK